MQEAGDGAVEVAALSVGQAGVGDFLDERVRELDVFCAALERAEDAGLGQGGELLAEGGVGPLAEQAAQGAQREACAEGCGGEDEALVVGGEAVDAGGEDALDGGRDGCGFGRRLGRLFEQFAGEFFEEEGVAAGALDERAAQDGAGDGGIGAFEQLAHAVGRERGEVERAASAGLPGGREVGPVGDEQERGGGGRRGGGEVERLEALVVGPLQVFDQDKSGQDPGGTQGGDAVEDGADGVGDGVAAAERVERVPGGGVLVLRQGEEGEGCGDVRGGAEAVELAADAVDRVVGGFARVGAEAGAQEGGDELVGDLASVGDGAGLDERPAFGGQALAKLPREAGLADAGVGDDCNRGGGD